MGTRILIIEDEPRHAELAASLLREAGHEVLAESTGEAGLRAVRRWRPDLVLCDLVLPDVGGVYIVSRIRSDPVLADLPVVAFTSLAAFDTGAAAVGAGFTALIEKPIEAHTFAARVAALIAPR